MKKTLTTALLAAFSSIVLAQQPASPGEAMIQSIDADKDGRVSLAEFQKPSEQQFKSIDNNSDGFIDVDEANQFAQEMQQRMQQMQQQRGGQAR